MWHTESIPNMKNGYLDGLNCNILAVGDLRGPSCHRDSMSQISFFKIILSPRQGFGLITFQMFPIILLYPDILSVWTLSYLVTDMITNWEQKLLYTTLPSSVMVTQQKDKYMGEHILKRHVWIPLKAKIQRSPKPAPESGIQQTHANFAGRTLCDLRQMKPPVPQEGLLRCCAMKGV